MKCDANQALIINALLDKYERSSYFRDNSQPARRIMLDFYAGGKSAFLSYDIEQSEQRELLNRAVEALAKQELVSFCWMKGEYRHIIGKVWLNMDKLDLAYRSVERNPKGDAVDKVCDELKCVITSVKSQWVSKFIQDALDETTRKRDVANILPHDDTERSLLLRAVTALDEPDGSEYMERVFSMKVFGDSKIFERTVKSRLLRILRRYLDNDDDVPDEELLKQIGIVKYPEQFEFCGQLSVATDSGIIDFSCLPGGSVIYSTDIISGRIIIDPSVSSILTIENRANYIDYIHRTKAADELVIYHGGQYSPRKRGFLQAVAKAAPDGCLWSHWSDIDYGGFRMLLRLRHEVFSGVRAHRMGVNELKQYRELTACIAAPYAEKLASLKSCDELSDMRECIDYMLKHKVRLEQEAMLTQTLPITK